MGYMEVTQTKWEELSISNDFLFGKVMQDPELCRELLQRIKEDNSISMGDETVKIFLNADGTMDDVSMELKAFLDYVAGQKPEDSYVEKLEKAVQEARKNREWQPELH